MTLNRFLKYINILVGVLVLVALGAGYWVFYYGSLSLYYARLGDYCFNLMALSAEENLPHDRP